MTGRSNLDILEHVNLVLDNLKKDYDEIQVVMTLTEIGRELVEVNALLANSSHYNDVWKGADWPEFSQLLDYTASFEQLQLVQQETQNTLFGHSINLCLTLQKAINLKDLFSICERYTFLAIDKSLAERNVKYALARNFTNTVESNYNIVNKLIKSRWVDIIAERGGLTPYPNPVYCLTQMAIAPLVKFSEPLNTKQDWLSVLQLAEQAIDWLDASPYNSKRASKHPLEQAHQWWAEYLHYKLQG
jgi:hypothetical protein